MRIAPNLPDIWSRRSRGVSTVLQSNVDAVIAQVNGYAAAHGIQYGMISNLLWSWVLIMDGCNNMKVSAAFRYDAMQPTILQIHTWVTAMSLRHKPLASWTTNKLHPASALATRSSKRLKGAAQSASDRSHHQPGKSEAKTPAKTSPGVSGSSQRHTATLALHANAMSAAIGLTFGIADRLLTAAAKFDVDDVCGVVALGSTGPVYHARTVTGQSIALKIASLGSRKHNSLKHQYSCLMAVRSLWGRCVPGLQLAGPLTSHGHGYGLGTSLFDGRHPKPGDAQLLPYAEEALRQVHGCQILINDLHNKNIVIVPDSSKSQAQVFFVDFSLSQAMPSMAQCQDELQAIKTLFK